MSDDDNGGPHMVVNGPRYRVLYRERDFSRLLELVGWFVDEDRDRYTFSCGKAPISVEKRLVSEIWSTNRVSQRPEPFVPERRLR